MITSGVLDIILALSSVSFVYQTNICICLQCKIHIILSMISFKEKDTSLHKKVLTSDVLLMVLPCEFDYQMNSVKVYDWNVVTIFVS